MHQPTRPDDAPRFCYHFNALDGGGGDTSTAAKRIADLERRAADLTPTVDPKEKPPGYEKLVRYAASRTDNDESEWAYFWHAASAQRTAKTGSASRDSKSSSAKNTTKGTSGRHRCPTPSS